MIGCTSVLLRSVPRETEVNFTSNKLNKVRSLDSEAIQRWVYQLGAILLLARKLDDDTIAALRDGAAIYALI